MRPAMYGAYHHITVLGKENALHDRTYDVTAACARTTTSLRLTATCRASTSAIMSISMTPRAWLLDGYNYNGKLRSAELLLREDGSSR